MFDGLEAECGFVAKMRFWYQTDPFHTDNNSLVPINTYKAIVA